MNTRDKKEDDLIQAVKDAHYQEFKDKEQLREVKRIEIRKVSSYIGSFSNSIKKGIGTPEDIAFWKEQEHKLRMKRQELEEELTDI